MALRLGALLLAGALSLFAQSTPLTIRNVRVVDVVERRVTPARTVYIVGDRFTAAPSQASARVIEGGGRFLIPGLWDMSGTVPATGPDALVRLGITGVLDTSDTPLEAMLGLWRKVEAGLVVGPRILTGGRPVAMQTANEARAWFDDFYRTDADFIPFANGIGIEAYIALAEQSRKWRLPLVGPLPDGIRLTDAVSLRQSMIMGTAGLERVACEGFGRAARDGVWFAPYARLASPELSQFLRACGARLLAGSATGGGGALHDELEALVANAGLQPIDALRAATYEPAQFLGSEVGVIAPGKLADAVLLDADPTADIRNVRRVQGVVLRGKWVEVPTIGKSASRPNTP